MRLFLVSAVIAALLVAAASRGRASAAPLGQGACPGNMLVNPDFEGGSRKTESEGTSLSSAVSNGWNPWFVRGDATVNREPEFKVEQTRIGGDPSRVRSGTQSMKWFTTWGTHTAGMYQKVNTRAGTPLTFSINGMAYTGQADGWNDAARMWTSDPVAPGNYRMSVGIDPTGAVPPIGSPPPSTVIWSEPVMDYDKWVPLSVSATAASPSVTVYSKGQPEWSVKHNDSFWEDACLRVGTHAPVGAGAAPIAPKAPVAAPIAPVPATAASAGSGACRINYTVKGGDTVSAIAAANGSTTAAIAGASKLANPSRINVGQVLCIP